MRASARTRARSPGWRPACGARPTPPRSRRCAREKAGRRPLRLFEHVLAPALLQTADYARAVLSTRPHTSADEIEELVTARLARQALLTRAHPPLLYVLLD